jgi:hypothetical protein
MSKHPTKHVQTVTVIDPDTGGEVEVEIRKDMVTGAMVGLDGSYLENDVGEVHDPYNGGELLDVPDDENIILCSNCGKPTTFERHNESEPREGEKCDECDEWVCPACHSDKHQH